MCVRGDDRKVWQDSVQEVCGACGAGAAGVERGSEPGGEAGRYGAPGTTMSNVR